jgi:Family of unknown function (DUF6098)
VGEALRTVRRLDELAALVGQHQSLFVRWSRGPDADHEGSSTDDMTGVEMPGLSANPLDVEPWWGDRSRPLWVARRLHDYSHLEHEKGPDVRPWVLLGHELGRGPDNEPLVQCDRPVAWIADGVLEEARQMVEEANEEWGPLNRSGA